MIAPRPRPLQATPRQTPRSPRSYAIVLGVAFAGGLIGSACRAVPPAPAPIAETQGSAAGSASAALPVGTAAPVTSLVRLHDGCWGPDLPPEPGARLSRIGERCAEGMTPAGAYSTTPVGSAPTTLSTLASGGCMRAAAMAAESGVELSLVDAEGKVVATDRDPAFALVPAGGPLCPRGALTLRARRLGGDGLIFWQTWSTR